MSLNINVVMGEGMILGAPGYNSKLFGLHLFSPVHNHRSHLHSVLCQQRIPTRQRSNKPIPICVQSFSVWPLQASQLLTSSSTTQLEASTKIPKTQALAAA